MSPRQIAKVFERVGLDALRGQPGARRASADAGRAVRENRCAIVFTEKDADGSVPWYLDGFSFVQDTPLKADQREQLSCRRERGTADSPLLMLNHWADLFPPRLRANRPFQEKSLIRAGAALRAQARPAGQPHRRGLLRPGRPHPGRAQAQRAAGQARPARAPAGGGRGLAFNQDRQALRHRDRLGGVGVVAGGCLERGGTAAEDERRSRPRRARRRRRRSRAGRPPRACGRLRAGRSRVANSCGSGLPTMAASRPVATSTAATIAPVPGQRPSGSG